MRKLLWFTIGVVIAALLGTYLLSAKWYLLAAGICAVVLVVCLVSMLRLPKMRIAAMVSMAAAFGFLWLLGYDALCLSVVRAYDMQTVSVIITATDYSYETDYGAATEGKVSLHGRSYKILAYHEKEIVLAPGDRLQGDFELRSCLPGGAHESSVNRSNNIFLTARPRGELTTEPCQKTPLAGYPSVIRRAISDQIHRIFSEDTASFACALLLGQTDEIDYETDTALKVSGIRHVIAVSGLHVTILFSLVYVFTGRRRWITALVGIPVLFLFAAVAGFSPSITRACMMHSLMVVGMLFDKEYDPPTALSFAVLCMLLINPWVATNVGFQLSAGCMIGILLFSERIKNYLMSPKRFGRFKGIKKKLSNAFSASVSVSLSAVIVTTPLCAAYFGMVSLLGPLTNLLTLWVISFVFYGIMLACAVGAMVPVVGGILAWLIAWPIRYVLWMADTIAMFPLSAVYTRSVYILLWLVFIYLLLAVYYIARRKRPLLLSTCAVIGLCVALLASWTEQHQDKLRMTVLDVGQGQCILLQSEGKNFLVDCGSYSDTFAADEAAALLLSQGIYHLDGMIVTHFDYDHAGGVWNLLTRVPADVLYLPNCVDEDSTGQLLYSYTDGTVVTVKEDMVITFGQAKISMFPSQTAISNNESGLCILFQRENCDILITGDRNAAGELELIRHTQLPELEVLIVGHHGSKTSTSRELLIKTSPEIAIISVGENNSYGHPTDEVLERLQKFGCMIYRTDLDGTIVYKG